MERSWWSDELVRGGEIVRRPMPGRHAAEVAVTRSVTAVGGPAGGATAPAAGGPLAPDRPDGRQGPLGSG